MHWLPRCLPVMLVGEAAPDEWLEGATVSACKLIRSYPAEQMEIVQQGSERKDLAGAR